MPRSDYTAEDVAAFMNIVNDPMYAHALRKFFTLHDVNYTEKARIALNAIPDSLDQQAKQAEMAKQYAAMAKAYGTAWAELEKAAG
jgi:hypothetical protein